MKKSLLLIGSILIAGLFMGANLHHQTSVDPITLYLTVNIGKEELVINLESPGLIIKKYPDGYLKHLTVPFINSIWKIYFYPHQEEMKIERVSLVQRFRERNNYLLLHGQVESYNEYGRLMASSVWYEGKLHGKSEVYNSYGQLIEEKEYEEGFPVNEWKQYYDNGEVATKVSFPPSKKDWEDADLLKVSSEDIFSIASHEALNAEEIWYDESGLKIKEIIYELYQRGERYVIEKTGVVRSFEGEEKLVMEESFLDSDQSGNRRLYYNNLGKNYENRQIWYGGKLFKTTRIGR